MKIKVYPKKPRIELIPLLDMIFIVLVCFVYTFLSMTIQRGLHLDLPKADASQKNQITYLNISLSYKGDLYVDDKKVDRNQLKNEIKRHIIIDPNIKVLLSADKNVVYENVVDIIDLLKQSGIAKVSLQTQVAANE